MARRRGRPRRARGRKLNKRQVRQVKSIITRNEEVKIKDTLLGSTSISSTAGITAAITAVAVGTEESQRVGDEIRLKSIHVNANILGADATNVVRLIWFQWIPNNASQTPNAGSLLQDTTYPWMSPINETNQKAGLFRIISDKRYQLTTSGSNQGITLTKTFYGRKIPRKNIEFNPAQSTGFNQIYCLYASDSVAASHPTFTYYTRVSYSDS